MTENLKKMRRRLILAAMLAFFTVIMVVSFLVNAFNYAVVTERSDETLEAILSFEEKRPGMQNAERPDGDLPAPENPGGDMPAPDGGDVDTPPMKPFMGLPDVEANYMTRFFTVRFDEKGEVIFASTDYIAAIDRDTAVEYAKEILDSGSEHGYMKAYRYMKAETGDTTVVAFLNTTQEQQSMISLLILTLCIAFASLAVVFLLVGLFSKRATRPYANSIKQQKQFITDASHELKTPLTSILTSLDVITVEHGEDEWTDNIRKQTDRMSGLVKEMVTLSRFDEEMPLPDRERFLLSDAASETADAYRQQAVALEKSFKVDIEDAVEMTGEENAVRKMMSVLLDNAMRYSDEKGEIRFSVYRKKNRTCIEVFNTCDLKDVPDVERLFDRFYRPDESRSTVTGGNGLGLSIAKAIAMAHGGKISAECPSGKTMTIRIVF